MTTPMTQLKPESTERAVAGAAGLAWLLTVTLVATQADTDPVGASYDAANRSLTLALGLLAASGYLAWQRSRSRADAVRAIGLALALVGNLLEFWVLWASGGTTDATATRLGEDGALLSPVGFGVFAVGMLVQFGAGVARSRRRSLARPLLSPVSRCSRPRACGLSGPLRLRCAPRSRQRPGGWPRRIEQARLASAR